MLTVDNCLLLVIDMQERLMPMMSEKTELIKNAIGMIKGAQILGLPIIATEQAPAKIGRTINEIAELLKSKPIEKITFSCCADAAFMQALGAVDRKQILVIGIETHVCVYQTVQDLVNLGYDVQVVSDAVSSRTEKNKLIGLQRIREVGAGTTGTETALCELLRVANGEKFKGILNLIK